MKNTSGVGDLTEAVVLAELAKSGYTVLVPFGVTRYDLAIDDRSGLGIKTIQCKTGRLREGCIVWNTSSSQRDTKLRTSYRGQVDYFGVWCQETGHVLLVPVADVGAAEGRLRLDPTRNGQKLGVRLADGYVVRSCSSGG